VVTCSACNPRSRGFETRQGSTNLCDKMRPDSVWELTHMCGPEQAVNVQLLAGEGNGKPPPLTSFPSPGVGSRKTEKHRGPVLGQSTVIIIIIIIVIIIIFIIIIISQTDTHTRTHTHA